MFKMKQQKQQLETNFIPVKQLFNAKKFSSSLFCLANKMVFTHF